MSIIVSQDKLKKFLDLGIMFGAYEIEVSDVSDTYSLIDQKSLLLCYIEDVLPSQICGWVDSFAPATKENGVMVVFNEAKAPSTGEWASKTFVLNLISHFLIVDGKGAEQWFLTAVNKIGVSESQAYYSPETVAKIIEYFEEAYFKKAQT